MVYLPSVRSITVEMSKLAGPATARWYDPTNGSYSAVSGSPIANANRHQFVLQPATPAAMVTGCSSLRPALRRISGSAASAGGPSEYLRGDS